MVLGFGWKKEKGLLLEEIERLKGLLSPEQQNIAALQGEILVLEEKKKNLEVYHAEATTELQSLYESIQEKKQEIVQLDDEILFQDYALYKPIYDFASSEEYKDQLELVRSQQKAMIKNKTACHFGKWTVDGSAAKGKKLVNDNVKEVLRCFNNECENAIDRVKYSNVESMKTRIHNSYRSLNKLNQSMGIYITYEYFQLKMQELSLAIEYALKKQEEKELARQARAELREQQKLEAEIKAARERLEKDRKHFSRALLDLDKRIFSATEDEKQELLAKRDELLEKLDLLEKEEQKIDYREQNAKAGYVYIISNIGSFGENIYKIGMTRRLEPLDRVAELGDASVPFKFDVHALIFSEDAPKLESALHNAFDDRKVNMVNGRKEFFHVTLEEIKKVVRENFDRTIDFVSIPDAEEYRRSQAMRLQPEQHSAASGCN